METSSESRPLVNVVVRNVYTPSESLALSVDPQTLVGELKRRLSVEFPSNPPVASQKLIFGGKICRDEEPLTQVLAQMQSSQKKSKEDGDEDAVSVVFHLLVNGIGNGRKDKSEEGKTLAQTEAPQAQDPPRPSESPASTQMEPPSPSTLPQTQTQYQAQTQTQTQAQYPSMFSPPPGVTQQQEQLVRQSLLVQQQVMVLQQIQYLQYLLMQQRHQQSTPNVEAQHHPFGLHYAPPYGNMFAMMQQQQQQQQQMFHPTARPPAHPIPGQNSVPAPAFPAAAAPAAPEPPQSRSMLVEMAREVYPLLDFRMALKMAFMLFIIGQDTPMDRILLLGFLSFISYLHITGIFAKIYEVYSRRRRRNGQEESTAPPGAAAAASNRATSGGYGSLTRILRISADRGLGQDIKHFVVGFLLSLVPAWHPQPMEGGAPMPENAMPENVPLQGI